MPCNTLLEFVTLVWIINSGKAYVDRHQEGGNGKACSDPGAVKRYSWNMEESVDSGNTSTDGTWFWRTYEMPHGTSKPYVTYASKHTSDTTWYLTVYTTTQWNCCLDQSQSNYVYIHNYASHCQCFCEIVKSLRDNFAWEQLSLYLPLISSQLNKFP